VSQVSSLFGLVIFWIGSHVQAGLDPNPLIYAPVHHHAQLFVR
jgi:predicted HAD superfamily Cof-like phosphohydrolase